MADNKESLSDKLTGALWDRIGNFFVKMWDEFWTSGKDHIIDFFKAGGNVIWETFSGAGKKYKVDPVDELLSKETDPDVIIKHLKDMAKGDIVPQLIYYIVNYALAISNIGLANVSQVKESATQSVRLKTKYTIPGIEYMIETFFRDPSARAKISDNLGRLGLSDENIGIILTATQSLLAPSDLRDAYLRGEISETKVNETLQAYHYNETDIEKIKSLYKVIPPVQDIITMAVREAFSPEIAEKFGQFQDFPGEFGEWAAKQGLTKDWAQRYWAAHWKLPGITDGFEMLHRGVITPNELKLLLKAQDVMPFWREKLTKIGYSPYTRVDVRRMHKLGVLTDEDVYRSYLDLGYDPDKAGAMTEFTLAYNQTDDRELSKTDIINLYKKHALSNEDCLSMLEKIGYNEDNANLLITKADFENYASYKKRIISYVGKAYVSGKINNSEVLNRLGKLNMPSDEINFLIETWDNERDNKVKLLSLDNLKAFYKAKIISDNELKAELHELGYNMQDVERFSALFKKR